MALASIQTPTISKPITAKLTIELEVEDLGELLTSTDLTDYIADHIGGSKNSIETVHLEIESGGVLEIEL